MTSHQPLVLWTDYRLTAICLDIHQAGARSLVACLVLQPLQTPCARRGLATGPGTAKAGVTEGFDIAQLELLDSYRLLNGAVVDLRSSSLPARLFLLDVAARLAQGQGYHELLARVMRPDVPLYEGMSPLSPGVHELPALRAANDLVYRAGVAEGVIVPGPAEAQAVPLPGGLRPLAGRVQTQRPREGGLTTEAIVTVGEAMDMLGITRQAVINSVRTGRVRGEQHGKLWILSREDVLRYRLNRDERRQARGDS